MKWLVVFLVLVNVALYGYFQWNGQHAVEPAPGHQDISPEKIKLLTPEELAKIPPREAAAPPPPALCYEWGTFSGANANNAQDTLNRMGLKFTARQQTPQEAIRYWVYIPPRKSLAEAQAKVEELKSMNVQESFIMQEPKWRNAISLGLFREEASATKFLEDMRGRGVKSAVKGTRNHEGGQTSFSLLNVTAAQAEELGKLKPEFPDSELRQVNCP